MKEFEVAIDIICPEHVDAMILGLVHQGYNVYYNREEKKLCLTTTDDDVTEITKGNR